jgi:hypothetical protein
MKTAGAAGTPKNACFPGFAPAGAIQQAQQVGKIGHRLTPAAESPLRGQQQQQAQQQNKTDATNRRPHHATAGA